MSIIFNVLLLLPLINYLLHVLQLYDSKGPLKIFGISTREITALAAPYIFLLVIYSVTVFISVYFNLRKKYAVNVPFSGTMFLLSLLTPLMINSEFVHKIMDSIFHD